MTNKLFYLLFFTIPLVLFPKSSEVFEFNKMVVVYILTTLIMLVWVTKSIIAKKIIFHRSLLDIPLLIFLAAITLSTIFSIDVRTSLLGYYSRFHGGLLSYVCYSLLYWAFVSNFPREKIVKLLLVIATSTIIASSFGALEHFGYFPVCAPINLYEIQTQTDQNKITEFSSLNVSQKIKTVFRTKCWQQDVQNRVFSTFGQPNWLAAWLVAVLPIIWMLSISNLVKRSKLIWYILSALFFATLLFTKSRSGLLGLLFADVIFWGISFLHFKKKVLFAFVIHNLLFLILFWAIGSSITTTLTQTPVDAPALEAGGTESGEIRKIVWKGAFDLWKKYPIFGTGLETFAYSYYETRPIAHNLVSEWNFIYNRAHNEYLNFAATTGTLGLGAYLLLIGAIILQMYKSSNIAVRSSILAGFGSILVTNFFGFSVVPTALLFFLYPGFIAVLKENNKNTNDKSKVITKTQKILLACLFVIAFYLLFIVARYWYADFLYARGRLYNKFQRFIEGREHLVKAVKLSPQEPIFWSELSNSSAELSIKLMETGNEEGAKEVATTSLSEAQEALSLSPRSLNSQRTKISNLIKLGVTDPNYLPLVAEATKDSIAYAPTDASLYYSLALTLSRLGENLQALDMLDKTIELKPNYRNARYVKALILIKLERRDEARKELVYILEKIDPDDNLVREELEKI